MGAKLLLIDGSSLMYRAFYGMGQARMTNQEGLPTGALFAFVRMLEVVMRQEQPSHILVAFDAGKVTFRTEKFEDYKKNRASMPEELVEQVPYFWKMLEAMGIKVYEQANIEADDIIGTLSERANAKGLETLIMTGDRDMLQLVKEHVTVAINKSGATVTDRYTPESFQEEYGIKPIQFIDVKALAGDSSDNYKGVTGVGQKTALTLIQTYGDLDNLYAHVDEMKKSKRKDNLIAEKDEAYKCQDLARIRTAIDFEEDLSFDAIKWNNKSTKDLADLWTYLGFSSYLDGLPKETKDLFSGQITGQVKRQSTYEGRMVEIKADNIDLLTSLDQAILYTVSLKENYQVEPVEAIIAAPRLIKEGKEDVLYIIKPDLVKEDCPKAFKDWLSSAKFSTYDAKRLWVTARRHFNWPWLTIEEDALLEAYIAKTTASDPDPAQTVLRLDLGHFSTDDEIYGTGVKRHIPEKDVFYTHLGAKMTAIRLLLDQLPTKLKELSQWQLVTDMELPLAAVLARMEIKGIKLNRETLEQLGVDFTHRIADLEADIYQEAGEKFNLNSPKQLGSILFEKLHLPVIKKTKTGYSTAADVLEKLENKHPIIGKLLDYRQLSKLQSTYVEGLEEAQSPDGRIHCRFIQTLTQTGRLSSADPNLQNIPVKTKEGREIRRAFEPDDDNSVLLSSDYSQIELRVLAHMSGDQAMQEAFREGEDIHTETAMRVFKKASKDEVTPLDRRHAKAVNFGIVYGISDYGLSQNLNISRKRAKEFIDNYLATYPGIQSFMTEVVDKAKEKGYVETLYGRRRYLPDLLSKNFNQRSFAERMAMNSPIQGTAADILKVAMVKIDEVLREKNYKTAILLQVHDELVLNVPKNELDVMVKLIPQLMEEAIDLAVPLISETNYGATWYEAK
ncbi:DNA polymerase I [Atopobacter sp. AH10]|uniref:DNA polymerase I n=1 Tax=Atopobacter sp. AH10 TaxID=2315861 RepID=UPI000EF23787|nr:DNA polymerase I [Atopobacter sp. AH10]RLK64130.1 DNA polymerase I [Atopobacter sp. AH10]